MHVDAGLNEARDSIYDKYTHIAIGTGTTPALASDTALETEIFPDGANRNTITSKTKPSAKKVRLQTELAAGEANGNTITEIGALSAAVGGILLNRTLPTPIVKDASLELKIQILTEMSDV